jgi:enamine deaminase RidA (YjgF/YER057c/UK114 family)
MSQVETRLRELGVALPTPVAAVANYVPTTQVGALLFVSGQLPYGPGGTLDSRHLGPLTATSPMEPAQEAARFCVINVLAQVKAAVGDLDRVRRVVRLGGFFGVDPRAPFPQLPKAMNGASDLLAEIFGERGRHARTTVGVAHLPMGAVAEVEALFEIAP